MRDPLAGILVLACLLVLPALPASAADDGAREVSALVTIRHDPDSRAVLWPEVEAVLEGSPREGWTEKPPAVLAQAPAAYRSLVLDRRPADEPGVLAVRVRVISKSDEVGAAAMLQALVRRLENHLAQASRSEQEYRFAQLDQLRARLEALTREIGEIREEGVLPWPLSAAAFFETLLERRHEVRGRLLDLAIEEAALTARRDALREQMARAGQQAAKERAALDVHWKTILGAREAALANERANLKAGTGHPIDVAAAEEAAARARLERDEMLGDPAATPGGARFAAHEAALQTVEADLAVLAATRARLQALHEEMDAEIATRRADVLRATHREEELRVLRDRVLALTEALSGAQPPQVDVLSLD